MIIHQDLFIFLTVKQSGWLFLLANVGISFPPERFRNIPETDDAILLKPAGIINNLPSYKFSLDFDTILNVPIWFFIF